MKNIEQPIVIELSKVEKVNIKLLDEKYYHLEKNQQQRFLQNINKQRLLYPNWYHQMAHKNRKIKYNTLGAFYNGKRYY